MTNNERHRMAALDLTDRAMRAMARKLVEGEFRLGVVSKDGHLAEPVPVYLGRWEAVPVFVPESFDGPLLLMSATRNQLGKLLDELCRPGCYEDLNLAICNQSGQLQVTQIEIVRQFKHDMLAALKSA